MAVFSLSQPYINLHVIFGWQGRDRLRTSGMRIVHDLSQVQQSVWSGILARHAAIHGANFALMLPDGTFHLSTGGEIPRPVMAKAKELLRLRPPKGPFPPPGFSSARERWNSGSTSV